MEINKGRITPTSPEEAKLFFDFLKEQYVRCERPVETLQPVSSGQELTREDSYSLLCGIERVIKTPEIEMKPEEEAIVGSAVQTLAREYMGVAQAAISNFDLSACKDTAKRHLVVGFAFKMVTPSDKLPVD